METLDTGKINLKTIASDSFQKLSSLICKKKIFRWKFSCIHVWCKIGTEMYPLQFNSPILPLLFITFISNYLNWDDTWNIENYGTRNYVHYFIYDREYLCYQTVKTFTYLHRYVHKLYYFQAFQLVEGETQLPMLLQDFPTLKMTSLPNWKCLIMSVAFRN